MVHLFHHDKILNKKGAMKGDINLKWRDDEGGMGWVVIMWL